MGACENRRLKGDCLGRWAGVIVGLLLFAIPALASAASESSAGQKAAEPTAERLEQMREMRGRLLRDGVQLDEADARAVEKVLEAYDLEQRRARADVREARALLRELVNQDGVDERAYSDAIERLRTSHELMHRIKERRFDALMGVLSPEKTARLLVMLGKIHHERRRHRKPGPAKRR